MTRSTRIRQDDLTGAATRALLALHVADMHAYSPPGSVHALDFSALRAPGISVFSAWADDRIAAVGAIRLLDDGTAELKSMRTHPDFLRQGIAAALLEHLIETARQAGVRRLSLETGSGPAFEPALVLYGRRGFTPGEAFGGYRATDFNRFLHLTL